MANRIKERQRKRIGENGIDRQTDRQTDRGIVSGRSTVTETSKV